MRTFHKTLPEATKAARTHSFHHDHVGWLFFPVLLMRRPRISVPVLGNPKGGTTRE
jgi:hypothetical protein